MDSEELFGKSRSELLRLARDLGIAGRHAMRKSELAEAVDLARRQLRRPSPDELHAMTLTGLRRLARVYNVPGRRAMNRHELASVLQARIHRAGLGEVAALPVGEAGGQVSRVEGFQEAVEDTKFYVGPIAHHVKPEFPQDLPVSYHEDVLVLMARNPSWIFGYWEVTPHALEKAREAGFNPDDCRRVIRLYEVTNILFDGTNAHHYWDIDVGSAQSWHIPVWGGGRSYVGEWGLLSSGGEFYPIVRSNGVDTPTGRISEAYREEWLTVPAARQEPGESVHAADVEEKAAHAGVQNSSKEPCAPEVGPLYQRLQSLVSSWATVEQQGTGGADSAASSSPGRWTVGS